MRPAQAPSVFLFSFVFLFVLLFVFVSNRICIHVFICFQFALEGGFCCLCMLSNPSGAEEDADADARKALQTLEVEEEEKVREVRGHFQE